MNKEELQAERKQRLKEQRENYKIESTLLKKLRAESKAVMKKRSKPLKERVKEMHEEELINKLKEMKRAYNIMSSGTHKTKMEVEISKIETQIKQL